MRGKQDIEVVIDELFLKREETRLLHDGMPPRVGQNLFLDTIAALLACARQSVSRHSICETMDLAVGVSFLFGEKISSVRDDQPEVSCAGLINARIIDLIENPVTDSKPDLA
jgi:hypothetical protein